MKVIPVSEWKRLVGEQMKEALPAILSHNGIPFAVVAAPEDAVVLSDLHPRVRIHFKALEQKVRRGMPEPKKIYKAKELTGEETESTSEEIVL